MISWAVLSFLYKQQWGGPFVTTSLPLAPLGKLNPHWLCWFPPLMPEDTGPASGICLSARRGLGSEVLSSCSAWNERWQAQEPKCLALMYNISATYPSGISRYNNGCGRWYFLWLLPICPCPSLHPTPLYIHIWWLKQGVQAWELVGKRELQSTKE